MRGKNMETRIIRVYFQDLSLDWVDMGGYYQAQKNISKDELFEDLKNNGLEIIEWEASTFGALFFIEVRGTYTGTIKINETDINPKEFNWDNI